MNMKFLRILATVLFVLLAVLSACTGKESSKAAPVAVNGVLDLRNWNIEKDGPVKLQGQWDFYWKDFVSPDAFSGVNVPVPTVYANVPGFWKNIRIGGKNLPVEGFATYHLRILLNRAGRDLVIKHHTIHTAHRMFINGILKGQDGKLAVTAGDEIPDNLPDVVDAGIDKNVMDVVIHVSNFSSFNCGLGETIKIGVKKQILDTWRKALYVDVFLKGSIIVIGLFYLIIYLFRRQDRANLLFGVFCLMLALIIESIGENYFYRLMLPGVPYKVRLVLNDCCVFLAVAVFTSFIRELFPLETPRIFVKAVWMVSLLFSAATLVFPSIIYVRLLIYYQFFIIIPWGIILTGMIIIAVIRKREAAIIVLSGFALLFLSTAGDILSLNAIISSFSIPYMQFGIFFFIMCMASALALRMTRAFRAQEILSEKLTVKSRELTEKNIELDNDIAIRIQTERELTDTRNYLDNVFNSLSSILASADSSGRITQWNTRAETFTGIKEEDAKGLYLWDCLTFLKEFRDDIMNVINERNPRMFDNINNEETSGRYFKITLSPLKFSDSGGVVVSAEDCTELVMKEKQLRHAQKMETIGTLAGGLAHDFNNVLAGIIGPISLIQYKMDAHGVPDKEFMEKQLSVMSVSANRAADMIKQLLAVSKRREMDFTAIDLNDSIRNVLAICENSIDKAIKIKVSYSSKAVVLGDQTQIEQVLLNLCVNAVHAMTIMRPDNDPYKGELSVSIEKFKTDPVFCLNHQEALSGEYWRLSVQDTGVGMTEDIKAKIFDPFFTTKEIDKGTGLGLSMVYSIVKQHKGFMSVYSEPMIGSQFNIFLPSIEDMLMRNEKVSDKLVHLDGKTVLIVDDEAFIRDSLRTMAEEFGLKAIDAPDGEEALLIFEKEKDSIDIVILDMMMPKKSGRQTMKEMMDMKKDVRIIISSGFSRDDRVESMISLGAKAFIHKPYTIEKLNEALKEAFLVK
ncbi:MAG TPA: response regulator [Desulfomonilia bacterium]